MPPPRHMDGEIAPAAGLRSEQPHRGVDDGQLGDLTPGRSGRSVDIERAAARTAEQTRMERDQSLLAPVAVQIGEGRDVAGVRPVLPRFGERGLERRHGGRRAGAPVRRHPLGQAAKRAGETGKRALHCITMTSLPAAVRTRAALARPRRSASAPARPAKPSRRRHRRVGRIGSAVEAHPRLMRAISIAAAAGHCGRRGRASRGCGCSSSRTGALTMVSSRDLAPSTSRMACRYRARSRPSRRTGPRHGARPGPRRGRRRSDRRRPAT